jgi:hypothetical protein
MLNEKSSKPVKVFESTYDLILKYSGNKTAVQFIDEAVRFYVRSIDEGDPLFKINKTLDLISERQSTNLGLLCEVLRQAGILNGNGEITFTKPDVKG